MSMAFFSFDLEIFCDIYYCGKLGDLIDSQIDLFTVACLVAWPLNESEAGVDLLLIETSLLLLC